MKSIARSCGRNHAQACAVILAGLVLTALLGSPGRAYERPGRTDLVTRGQGGDQATRPALGDCIQHGGDMSSDGRFIAFHSEAPNIVPGDTNVSCDVFVRDQLRNKTERVSLASDGAQAVGVCAPGGTGSSYPSISNNGRFVAFQSCATNLVGGDTNLTWDVFVHDRKEGTTTRASLTHDGSQTPPATWSGFPDVGNRGQVVFASAASNLVPEDENGVIDVFLRSDDGRLERVSIATSGLEGNGASEDPTITPDGRLVVFRSTADNLVAEDANQDYDVFVRDPSRGVTELVSVASDGVQSNARSLVRAAYFGPSISADGRFVSFTSQATNLVPSDSNLLFDDGFVHDRKTGRTERVTVTSFGEQGRFSSVAGAISQTGRYVTVSSINDAFSSGPDGNSGALFGDGDIYLHDRLRGTLEWISVAPDGTEAQNDSGTAFFTAALSTDAGGRYVTFLSDATNLVAGDENDWRDVFVRDLGTDLGVGALGGEGSGHEPEPGAEICISPDLCIPPAGSISVVDASIDISDRHVTRDGSDLIEARVVMRPEHQDIFIIEELEHMPRVTFDVSGTSPGLDPRSVVYGVRFMVNRRNYEVRATSLSGGTFGLFDCTRRPICTELTALRGGFGTTGMRVVFSLPLEAIGLSNGGRLNDLEAFSALGSYQTGAAKGLDRITIE